MLTCGCGRWMHTEGVEEDPSSGGDSAGQWLVRFECGGCGSRIGALVFPDEACRVVDRRIWTDEAVQRLERMPPYLQTVVRDETDAYARTGGQTVISLALLHQARQGGAVEWEEEAERRLERVPAPVRAMARVELERTAMERGERTVTVALMEEVKARYFGMFVPIKSPIHRSSPITHHSE